MMQFGAIGPPLRTFSAADIRRLRERLEFSQGPVTTWFRFVGFAARAWRM